MIFWNEVTGHRVIEDKGLEELARENNCTLLTSDDIDGVIGDWLNYAHIVAMKHNFSAVYETTFIYYVTLYFAEQGISTGDEEKYFVKKLEEVIARMYNNSLVEKSTEVEQKRYLFQQLLNFFLNDLVGYERHLVQHNIRVSREIKDWFDGRDVSVRDTVMGLVKGTVPKPHLNANVEVDTYITFLLCYSDELLWEAVAPNMLDPDRLRILLY